MRLEAVHTYIYVAVITGASEHFLSVLVYATYLVVVDVFEEEDWLGLSCVPHTDGPVEAT